MHSSGATFQDVETANAVLHDFPVGQAASRKLCEVVIGSQGSTTGLILAHLVRNEADPCEWIFRHVAKPCSGRNLQESLPEVRTVVDTLLPEWASAERVLSIDKTFNMEKNDVACLPKELSKVNVGLGWSCEASIDLDASVVLLTGKKGDRRTHEVVFFGHKRCDAWGVYHCGDNLTGAGDGDDETITVDLDKAAAAGGPGASIVATVNIYSWGASFSNVHDAYVRLLDTSGHVLARFNLTDDIGTKGVVFCALEYQSDSWHLHALGTECDGSSAKNSKTQKVVKTWDSALAESPAVPRAHLVVEVIAAQNVPIADSNGKSDPYITMTVNGEQKQKTTVKKKDLNPTFNETFTFECDPSADFTLELKDYDRFSANDLLASYVAEVSELQSGELTLRPRGSYSRPNPDAPITVQVKFSLS